MKGVAKCVTAYPTQVGQNGNMTTQFTENLEDFQRKFINALLEIGRKIGNMPQNSYISHKSYKNHKTFRGWNNHLNKSVEVQKYVG